MTRNYLSEGRVFADGTIREFSEKETCCGTKRTLWKNSVGALLEHSNFFLRTSSYCESLYIRFNNAGGDRFMGREDIIIMIYIATCSRIIRKIRWDDKDVPSAIILAASTAFILSWIFIPLASRAGFNALIGIDSRAARRVHSILFLFLYSWTNGLKRWYYSTGDKDHKN